MSKVKGFEFKAKADRPYISHKVQKRQGKEATYFIGVETGVSAGVSLYQVEEKINKHVKHVTGPGGGARVGAKAGTENSVEAMAELSVSKFEANVGPVYRSLGVNANTGVSITPTGVCTTFLGFGWTLGAGGRFGINTPLGSLGVGLFNSSEDSDSDSD